MKKRILTWLCLLAFLFLCACGKKDAELQVPVNFYYCNEEISYNSSFGVIRPEAREAEDFYEDASKLFSVYLDGPVSAELVSPLPAGTGLVSLEFKEDTAHLTLTQEFATLSGVKLSTACSCIVMTLSEYAGISQVHFYVKDGLIDNRESLVVNNSDIVLMDHVEQKG